MKHENAASLTLAEAAGAHGDRDTLALLAAAETEAADLEAQDAEQAVFDMRRAMLKVAVYREADYHRCQLRTDLRRQLQDGDLVATARERPAGPRIEVPAAAWRHLCPELSENIARDGMGQVALYDVGVAAAGSPAPAAMPSRDTAPVHRAAAEPTPAYSLAALRSWYRLRGASWPAAQPPPSEPADRAAASKHFGIMIPRAAFRAIRRELAPAHWLKPGPRKAPL